MRFVELGVFSLYARCDIAGLRAVSTLRQRTRSARARARGNVVFNELYIVGAEGAASLPLIDVLRALARAATYDVIVVAVALTSPSIHNNNNNVHS